MHCLLSSTNSGVLALSVPSTGNVRQKIMKALSGNLTEVKEEARFYKGRLFPDHTPAHGATHAASVSMTGGGGNRGASPALIFWVATRVVFLFVDELRYRAMC